MSSNLRLGLAGALATLAIFIGSLVDQAALEVVVWYAFPLISLLSVALFAAHFFAGRRLVAVLLAGIVTAFICFDFSIYLGGVQVLREGCKAGYLEVAPVAEIFIGVPSILLAMIVTSLLVWVWPAKANPRA